MSPSTVSRTFSRPGRVSSRTARHVRTVAERLGYRAEEIYRPMTPSRTKTMLAPVDSAT